MKKKENDRKEWTEGLGKMIKAISNEEGVKRKVSRV